MRKRTKFIVIILQFLLCNYHSFSQIENIKFTEDTFDKDTISKLVSSSKLANRIRGYNSLIVSELDLTEEYNKLLSDTVCIIENGLKYTIGEYYFYKLMITKKRPYKCSHPFFKIGLYNLKNSSNPFIKFLINMYASEYDRHVFSSSSFYQGKKHNLQTSHFKERIEDILRINDCSQLGIMVSCFEEINTSTLGEIENYYFKDSVLFNRNLKNKSFQFVFKYYLYQKVISSDFCYKDVDSLLNKIKDENLQYLISSYYYQLVTYYRPHVSLDVSKALTKRLNISETYIISFLKYYCFPIEIFIFELTSCSNTSINSNESREGERSKTINLKLPIPIDSSYVKCEMGK